MKTELKKLMLYLIMPIYLCMAWTSTYFSQEIPTHHHYVHSEECQKDNYLVLDCFNHCNDKNEINNNANSHQSNPDGLKAFKAIDKFYSTQVEPFFYSLDSNSFLHAELFLNLINPSYQVNSPPPKV